MKRTFAFLLISAYLLSVPSFLAAEPPPKPGTQTNSPPDLGKFKVRPIGNWQVDPVETQYLDSLFANTIAAREAILSGPDATAQQRAVDNLLRSELENFVATNANSAYAPSLHLFLGHQARMRSGYTLAMQHYEAAFNGVAGSPDPTALQIAHEAGGALAKLLALTGKVAELDALQASAGQTSVSSYDWGWANEIRGWVAKHPTEMFKCGLYCLDQLGRLTQSGQFLSKNVLENPGSTNGFTVADLLNIGTKAGLRVHAALLAGTNALPIPCVVHLRCEHFIVVREQRGAFFNVYDAVALGSKWMLLSEILEEATGCLVVSDVVPQAPGVSLTAIDSTAAANYRGRCHFPYPYDHDDNGSCPTCPCPPGSSSGNNSSSSGSNTGNSGAAQAAQVSQVAHRGGSISASLPPPPGFTIGGQASGQSSFQRNLDARQFNTASCQGCSGSAMGVGPYMMAPGAGMAGYSVSEPYLNLWLSDTPMTYTPAYGDPISLALSYTFRRQGSAISGDYWHGAQIGNYSSSAGVWSCSWLSFGELSTDESEVDLMLPGGGWATFYFPSGSNLSGDNYRHNIVLQKNGSVGNITSLVLTYPDGSTTTYANYDKTVTGYEGIFYVTSIANPAGNATTFAYNSSHYLTSVSAVDGTSFTINYTNSSQPSYITSVSASYGGTAYLGYDQGTLMLTNITDPVGLSSQFVYTYYSGFTPPIGLVTPYGTTGFDIFFSYMFDRVVWVTNTTGSIELYAVSVMPSTT